MQVGAGSNAVWTGSSGVATGAASWDAWGNVQSVSGSVGLHGFTGERTDPTIGLVYLRARDYSPGTAQFLSRDTVQRDAHGTEDQEPYS